MSVAGMGWLPSNLRVLEETRRRQGPQAYLFLFWQLFNLISHPFGSPCFSHSPNICPAVLCLSRCSGLVGVGIHLPRVGPGTKANGVDLGYVFHRVGGPTYESILDGGLILGRAPANGFW